MSKEAIEFKSLHKELNFKDMSLGELFKLPPYNGIYNYKISKTSFLMLNIINDDSSVVKHFWRGFHELEELDIWFEIAKNKAYGVLKKVEFNGAQFRTDIGKKALN